MNNYVISVLFKEKGHTEIYTKWIVGSVRCV